MPRVAFIDILHLEEPIEHLQLFNQQSIKLIKPEHNFEAVVEQDHNSFVADQCLFLTLDSFDAQVQVFDGLVRELRGKCVQVMDF